MTIYRSKSAQRGRLVYAPGLDGVRALAVTAVVLYHLGTTGLLIDGGKHELMPGGFIGVDVFFVLSGFLITSLLLAERVQTGRINIRQFYVRRARRLLPALYTMMLVVSIAAAFFYHDYAARLRGDLLAAFAYVTNWWLVAGGTSYFGAGTHPPLLTHLWSLALEEQFYLLWPLALIALTFVRKRYVVIVSVSIAILASTLLAAALFSPWHDPSRIYYGTDTRLATPLLGALLAIVCRPWRWRKGDTSDGRRHLVDVGGVLALIGLVLAAVFIDSQSPLLYRGGFLGIALLAGMLAIAAAHPDAAVGRVLGVKPLRWLGERSYAVYLWHWPIFAVTQPGVNVHLGALASTALRIALTLGAASLSYRFVEKPMRSGALGRAVKSWRESVGSRRAIGSLKASMVGLATIVVVLLVGSQLVSASAPSSAPVGPGPDTSLGALLNPSPVLSGGPLPSPSISASPSKSATPPVKAPANVPKVAIFGDSQGHTLLLNVPKDTGKYVKFKDDTISGCGFLVGKVTSKDGERIDLNSNCKNWRSEWVSRVKRDKPDIAMIMVGAWDVFDLNVNGTALTFGSAAWDANFKAQYQSALSALHASVTQVAISLLPCYRPVHASAGYWPERGDDSRTRHVNTLLTAAATANPSWITAIDPPHQFCDNPKIAKSLSYRWDGVHYYKPGALLYCQAVLPQLLAIKLD